MEYNAQFVWHYVVGNTSMNSGVKKRVAYFLGDLLLCSLYKYFVLRLLSIALIVTIYYICVQDVTHVTPIMQLLSVAVVSMTRVVKPTPSLFAVNRRVVLTSLAKMADSSGPISAKRCDSLNASSVSMDTITSLTELEDLERVYQQLCTEEVRNLAGRCASLLLVDPGLTLAGILVTTSLY